ncbi:MAG: DinB family protein, partial [Planctomycetaceae bacterium]|nr:DinB family protein [Planctomycetaceae bacterium]
MRLAEIMLPEFDREMARTRRTLAAVPAGQMEFKPHESLHTISWNANHIVDLVGWTPLIIGASEFDMAPVEGPKPQSLSIADPALLLAEFDKNVATARAALEAVSDATLAESWSLKAGGQVLFTISKGECVRTWVLNHAVHHRAILSVYLRMAGVTVTPPYDG